MTTTRDRPARTPARRQGRAVDTAHRIVDAGEAVAGQVFGVAFGGVARVRRDRPLHPHGVTYAAQVSVTGGGGSGVPWLDEPATHDATVRVSRSAGLPSWLPDVYGVALRLGQDTATPVDLLFATAWDSSVGRFFLQPRMRMAGAQLTTLWPVRSPAGPLLLRLVAGESTATADGSVPRRLVLSWATGRGPWHDAAEVTVGGRLPPAVDAERHDAVLHQLPGTDQYDLVSRLREPSYRAARTVSPRPR